MGRDPTPSEIHLHVHTHGHDGKSFIGARSRVVHKKYQEILQQQTQTESNIDQFQAYYQAAGGEKKNRIYGLGSQAKCYYGPNFGNSSASDASPSTVPLIAQSTPIGNLNELMTRLVPALTEQMLPALKEQMLPVLVEQVNGLLSSTLHQPITLTSHPLVVAPTVHVAPSNANTDEIHSSNSDDDRVSPTSH